MSRAAITGMGVIGASRMTASTAPKNGAMEKIGVGTRCADMPHRNDGEHRAHP